MFTESTFLEKKVKQCNGVPASGWDNAPLSSMIYNALFLPHFLKVGLYQNARYFKKDLSPTYDFLPLPNGGRRDRYKVDV